MTKTPLHWNDEDLTRDDAARAMLAALRAVESYFRSMDAENPEGQVLRAIAQAEAASITCPPTR
jgi:hypothetical protein